MDVSELPTKNCSVCRGDGEIWSDCGDSTCDCGGTTYPCGGCKGTGQVSIITQKELDALEAAGFEVRRSSD